MASKCGSVLLNCLKTSQELSEKLEVLALENNRPLAEAEGFGADLARTLNEARGRKLLGNFWYLSVTLNDFCQTPIGCRALKPGEKIRGEKAKIGKEPSNAFAFIKLMKQKDRPNIKWLGLKHARLSQKSVETLAQPEILQTLTCLDLTNAFVGALGVQALSNAIISLKERSSLIALVLHGNVIGDAGARAIEKTLSVNESITHVDLSSNLITDKGAAGILKALESNAILTSIRLGANRISPITVEKALYLAKKRGSPLNFISLDGVRSGVQLRSDLMKQLRLNFNSSFTGLPTSDEKVLVMWKKGYDQREKVTRCGADAYVNMGSVVLPRAFEVKHELVLSWEAYRVCKNMDEKQTEFIWKVVRERETEVAVVAKGTSNNCEREKKGNSHGDIQFRHSHDHDHEKKKDVHTPDFKAFQIAIVGILQGDKLTIKLSAPDTPRTSVVQDEEFIVRSLKVCSIRDESIGLLYNYNPGRMGDKSEDYSVLLASELEDQRSQLEEFRLNLSVGPSAYRLLHRVRVGRAGRIRLKWRFRIDEKEPGSHNGLFFSWFVMQRSFESTAIVASGFLSAEEIVNNFGDLQSYIVKEIVLTSCLLGDVLSLWVGTCNQRTREKDYKQQEKNETKQNNTGRFDKILPRLLNLKLYIDNSGLGTAMVSEKAFALSYPMDTVSSSTTWL